MIRLEKKVIWVFFIQSSIVSILLTTLWYMSVGLLTIIASNSLGIINLTSIKPMLYGFGVGIFVVYLLFGYGWAWLRYFSYSYALQDNGFYIEYGVLIKHQKLIDYATISEPIVTLHPLIFKFFGIGTLSFHYTEPREDGGNKAYTINLPGLIPQDAQIIKEKLMQLSHVQATDPNQPYRGVKIPT